MVVGIPDEEWGRRLHAIVQKKEEVSAEELIEYLGKHLLPYKVPKSFTFVPCIPTRNSTEERRSFSRRINRVLRKTLITI